MGQEGNKAQEQKNKFVHLHVHTEYSLLDGAVRITKPDDSSPLADALKARGMNTVAITDHGNMFGALTFASVMNKQGINAIIGCEFYTCDDMDAKNAQNREPNHLVLLAKTAEGYQNLMELNTQSYIRGYYYKPRIDLELLKKHSGGLVCLSACLAGRIPRLLLAGDRAAALSYAQTLQGIFGEDFYIEIQDHGIAEQRMTNPDLVRIADAIGAKVVATNDVHYLDKDDSDVQDTMLCIGTQAKKSDERRMKFEGTEFYLKTPDEMAELFKWCPDAITNTLEVAEKCKFRLPLKSKEYFIPEFDANDPFYQGLIKDMPKSFEPRIKEQLEKDIVNLKEKHAKKLESEKADEKGNKSKSTKTELKLPKEGDDTANTYLRRLTYTKISERYKEFTEEIDERIEYELDTIISLGYAEYYLVVWDFIRYAKEIGVPVGPGRGSGAGSIVAYIVEITDIDPLRFGLIFERFLNKERVSMPDFDIDFCENRRGEVIRYVQEKYGAENVSQIIAYSTMSAKAAIKDVARVYDIPFNEANDWVKCLPYGKITIDECLGIAKDKKKKDEKMTPEQIAKAKAAAKADAYYQADEDDTDAADVEEEKKEDKTVPEFVALYNTNPTAKNIIDTARKLEGMPRQPSVHAAGVVICRDRITEHCALQRSGTDITTQFDKNQVEEVGLLKMDFLGLTTLTDIELALSYIKKNRGIDIDFDSLSDDDPKVYELISSGDTTAIFQLESGGMTRFMSRLKPTSIEDITAGISLFRPGPMQFMDKFIRGKYHPETVNYITPELEPILNVTYGCIVYQEQVMDIARKLGGYSYGAADILRRAMSKKKQATLIENKMVFIRGSRKANIQGAVMNGVPFKAANALFDQILDFANYAFNKAHAAAYAVLTYRTAYLKTYFLVDYMTAVINNRLNKTDKLAPNINYIKSKNITLLQPSINESEARFTVAGDNAVRFGLLGIKNVGELAIETIIADRNENGKFKNFPEFLERALGLSIKDGDAKRAVPINKRMVESLIMGGACDGLGATRAAMLNCYEEIMDSIVREKKGRVEGQFSFFDDLDEEELPSAYICPFVAEMDKLKLLNNEKEVLGMYVSGHPLDDYRQYFDGGFTLDKLILNTAEEEGEDADEMMFDESDDDGASKVKYDTSYHDSAVTLHCLVHGVSSAYTKKKKFYVKGIAEDFNGSIEFMWFRDIGSQEIAMLNSAVPLKLSGRLNIKGDDRPTLFVSSVEIWRVGKDAEGNEYGSASNNSAADRNGGGNSGNGKYPYGGNSGNGSGSGYSQSNGYNQQNNGGSAQGGNTNGGSGGGAKRVNSKYDNTEIYLTIGGFDDAKALVPLLKSYPGNDVVYAVMPDGITPFKQRVRICEDLHFDLIDRLGKAAVGIKKKD